ncbi:MAG: hypothetical protein JJU34_12755 [Lunatimonas sp.]|uniref:hypothetical protein n=1 Tax=Lunatimonas sp. TaxID=2060141 RepID=UPI00263B0D14|nr:hypothetical protein [Lunatimonas sp.]MCC5938143.1 hypothetical protein [Lunatimonas sp.]
MNERINTSLHSISFLLMMALTVWYFLASSVTFPYVLTILIVALIAIEVISLIIISKVYPESHTSFKIGIIAGLCILLGIKTMLPTFFVPLTLTLVAVNFLYNFYSNNKRRRGAYKRKKAKRLKL